jgi:uncharacterized protein YkwD
MKKNFVMALVAVMVLAFVPVTMSANDLPLLVVINNEQVQFNGQQPIQIDGRTLVPARGVFEQLEFEVTWNGSYRQVEIRNEGLLIEVGIDSNEIIITTLPYMFINIERIDVPAQIINGSTMIPLRAVAQAIGAEVNWNGDTRTVYITTEATVPVFGQFTTEQAQIPQEEETRTANIMYGVGGPVEGIAVLDVIDSRLYETHSTLVLNSFSTVQHFLDSGYTLDETARMIEVMIHGEMNQLRFEYGLPPREWSDILASAARLHSEDLVVNNNRQLSHIGSNGSRSTQRAREAGWVHGGVGEIVVGNPSSAVGAVRHGWYMSVHHKEHMLADYENDREGFPIESTHWYAGIGIYIYNTGHGYHFIATAKFGGY